MTHDRLVHRFILIPFITHSSVVLRRNRAYLRKKWRALATLLGPVMLGMWLVSSVIVYLLFHGDGSFSWLESMVLGACITPTDPVLASSIVKGRFAEKHIPEHVRDLLSAERCGTWGCRADVMTISS